MIIRFDGQTVIVTGAGHGFGRAIALAFAERGASVWACDINAAALTETARLGETLAEAARVGETLAEAARVGVATPVGGAALGGGGVETRVVDVTDAEAVFAFVREAEGAAAAAGGDARVDVLVNNAGGVGGQVGRPLEEVSGEDWRALFAINVDAAFAFAQAASPGMKRARSGRIVNISSGAGLGISLTGIQAYASAKAAQIGLTRQLAHELGPWGITVNNVAPGFVRSNPSTERQWQSYGDEGQRALVERIALKRLGTPDDIAHAVLFFASPYAGWVTGQVLSVDGGK